MGEKGLALAEAGQGRLGAALLEKGERAYFGANLAGAADDLIVSPIKEYFENPGAEAAEKAFYKFLEGGGKVMFPVAGKVLEGGRFIIGTAKFTVEEMYEAGRRQQYEDAIFGRNAEVSLGSYGNLFAQEPSFFQAPLVAQKRITRQNIGTAVTSEAELRALWQEQGPSPRATRPPSTCAPPA